MQVREHAHQAEPVLGVELPRSCPTEVGHAGDEDGGTDAHQVGEAGPPGVLQSPRQLTVQLVQREQAVG